MAISVLPAETFKSGVSGLPLPPQLLPVSEVQELSGKISKSKAMFLSAFGPVPTESHRKLVCAADNKISPSADERPAVLIGKGI